MDEFAALADPQAERPGTERRRAAPSALTLVTVSHNSAAELVALIDSIERHLPGVGLVVVDCASHDASVERARRRTGVRVIALQENLGFGRGSNRGLAEVLTPVAALINPDVELLDDSLLAIAFEAQRAEHGERLLAPRVVSSDGRLQDSVHPAPCSAADLIRALVPPAIVPGRLGIALAPWRSRIPRRVGWAVGCALVARTATFRRLGPFDESIFMYGEDMELGLRASERGIPTWLWPAATVLHHGAHSSLRKFGGEPFALQAAARHDVVARRLGRRAARIDGAAQVTTFASRFALRRALRRAAPREREQLRVQLALRRSGDSGAPR